MTLVASRLEALIVARAGVTGGRLSAGDLVKPLARFVPPELTPDAWRERLIGVVSDLRAQGVLDAEHHLHDDGELTRRVGRLAARTWPSLADRVLPALALGIAAADGKLHARLAGRDAWAAAIVGRTLGLWRDGPPPSLPAVCDALAWRELGLSGKPKRCPPEIRALFLQRQLTSDAGPPERLVRVLAARDVGAPRPELRALRDALVRGWLAGRTLGAARPADDGRADDGRADDGGPAAAASAEGEGEGEAAGAALHAPGVAGEGDADRAAGFASCVRHAAGATRDGTIGDRKVFASAVWHELRRDPRWSALALDEFKARLVAAHRAGELVLARADYVAAMDPELVAASEITTDGASFHFIVKEPVS
jgi:hypothetical protein